MYNSRSVFSEDVLWSIFRFQISPYKFCPFVFVKNAPSFVSRRCCYNESVDSESGVFVECPAM